MLEINSPKFSWALLVMQQIGVPLLSLFATFLLATILTKTIPEGSDTASAAAGVIVYISPALFGFTFGVLARSQGPEFREAGRRIWMAPLCLFGILFLASLFSNWRQVLVDFFGVRGGATEEGIGSVLITFPTAACCFYAVGISLRKAFRPDRDRLL